MLSIANKPHRFCFHTPKLVDNPLFPWNLANRPSPAVDGATTLFWSDLSTTPQFLYLFSPHQLPSGKHTKSIKQLLNMAIEIYRWFTHQKLWFSIDFVCLPEGNPEITMKCDEALVWSCLPIVILPGNAIPDEVPDDFSWLIPHGWYMGGSRLGDSRIAQ